MGIFRRGERGLVFGEGLDDGLGADQDPGFAEKVETFYMYRSSMELCDYDREVFGLAELVFLVRDQAALFLGEAEQFRDGIIEESISYVLFVEGEVVLEMVAEGFVVLLVALAWEAFN